MIQNPAYVEIKDVVLFAIAIAGLVLGIYNAVRAQGRDKVKLKVTPKLFRSHNGGSITTYRADSDLNIHWDGFCIEVVNVGFIAVTIDEVGEVHHGTDERKVWIKPSIQNGSLPYRLEPRTSVIAYLPWDRPMKVDLGLPDYRYAYAATACNVTVRGTSPLFERLKLIGKRYK